MAEANRAWEILEISCGSSHSIAIRGKGECREVFTWGRGEDGQLGLGDADERAKPTEVTVLSNKNAHKVVCGAEYCLAITDKDDSDDSNASSSANNGSDERTAVYSWGWGDFGRLGHGHPNDVFIPQSVKGLADVNVKSIACGDCHTLALSSDGKIFAFGRNQDGQLGLGKHEDSLLPQQIKDLDSHVVVSIACGAEHSVCATSSGVVYAWGWGKYGNLGLGNKTSQISPQQVRVYHRRSQSGSEDEVKQASEIFIKIVGCGWRHSMAITQDGDLFTFGWSEYGQLGLGQEIKETLEPHLVEDLKDQPVRCIAGGWRHSIAVTEADKIYTWGWNKFGQLGIRSNEDKYTPQAVEIGDKDQPLSVRQVACGWRHTLAITCQNGLSELWAWGRGVNGQLGNGQCVDRTGPTKVTNFDRALENTGKNYTEDDEKVSVGERYAVVPDVSELVEPKAAQVPLMSPNNKRQRE